MADAIIIRFRLLGMLRSAGAGPVAAVVAITLLASLIPAATAVALALLVGGIEEAVRAGDGVLAALALPLAALASVILVGHLLDSVREPLDFFVRSRVDGAHRAEVSRLAATSLTIGELERPEVQNLVHLARADPNNWSERTPGDGAIALVAMLGRAITLVSVCAVLAAFAWWLIPLLVIPAVVFARLNRADGVTWWSIWRDNYDGLRRAKVWLEASIDPGPAKELKVFGLGEYAVGRVAHHTLSMFEPVWAHLWRALARYWRQFLLALVPLTVSFVVVAHTAATGRTSVAVATAAISAAAAVFSRVFVGEPGLVLGAVNTLDAYDKARAALQKDQTARLPDQRAAVASGNTDGVIRFEGVGFVYPGTSRLVLDGLDLEIRPRELLAVVGLNGAGKSTLIKLLAGLYEPTTGRITYGGRSIAAIGLQEWRRHLSIVFQDFVRYPLSAYDNVALGNGTVPPDRTAIATATRDAGLDTVLDRLPYGLSTPLARSRSDGVDLSGGQWQQVVLARALYKVSTGAHVLVLDEPTAHLDVATEFEVFERLAAHKGSASVVLISHRLSTVRQADRIVLLDGGRITEAGTHDELMALGGRYADLFTIQAERFNRGFEDRLDEIRLL